MFTVRNSDEIGRALDDIAAANVGAVNVLASPMLYGTRRQLWKDSGTLARVLFGGRSLFYVLAFTAICVGGIVFIQYKLYETFLKWLTLSLFAYVAAMFAAKVNWSDALSGVLLPRITWSNKYFTTLVAILGTTISPYLFFWQASQEAEDVHVGRRRKILLKAPRQALDAFARIRTDTLLGMALSNLIRACNHHHHSRNASPRRRHEHRNFNSGGRSAQTNRRSVYLHGVRSGHHRHRPARNSGPGGISSLCGGRGRQMAGRIGSAAEGGYRVLLGTGSVCRAWRRDYAQSD